MSALRAVVGGLGELLVTVGVLVLLFLVWQLWWTDVVAVRAQDRTTDALLEQWDAGPDRAVQEPSTDRAVDAPATDPVVDEPATDRAADEPAAAGLADLPSSAVAVLRVPAFGEEYARPVLAGTGTEVLRQGVGHYDGTAAPGEVGNFALAGHRTTWGAPFNPIAELVVGDPVVVETAEQFHVYRVAGTQVVLPGDVEVIAPVPGSPGATPSEAWLTMTSCHPMFSARQRFVVHARLESSTPRADGPPPAVRAAGAEARDAVTSGAGSRRGAPGTTGPVTALR